MINKELLTLMGEIRQDIPDWDMIYPDLQKAIAEWILEDREVLHEQAM